MNLMTYVDYKEFMRDQIEKYRDERGYQGKLAQAARCQKSYFSQVLSTKANLSPDQAMGVAEYWQLNEDETAYFLELVSLARSQYPPLVNRIQIRLREIREKHERKSKQVGASEVIVNDQWLYYSQWYWSAVHIIVGISGFQTPESIAQRLGLDELLVEQILNTLKLQGLVDLQKSRWVIKPVHRHLDPSSPLSTMNHSNWRHRALLDSQIPQSESLHYTSVQSHSRNDWQAIKDILLKGVTASRNIVKASSPDEELSCVCIDFFRLT